MIGVGFQLTETLEGQEIKRVLNFKPDETEKGKLIHLSELTEFQFILPFFLIYFSIFFRKRF